MYLFTTSRHGVPVKELQRQLGVSYPTAFRMAHLIRDYMGSIDGEPPLTDHFEVDETYVCGKRKGKRGCGAEGKTVVFDILERYGDLHTKVVPDASRQSLIPEIMSQVPAGAHISSDERLPYRVLSSIGHEHHTVDHGKKKLANHDTHVNTPEAFWSMLKRSIRGTHIHISPKHLPKYLGEFEYRYSLRKRPDQMFLA